MRDVGDRDFPGVKCPGRGNILHSHRRGRDDKRRKQRAVINLGAGDLIPLYPCSLPSSPWDRQRATLLPNMLRRLLIRCCISSTAPVIRF